MLTIICGELYMNCQGFTPPPSTERTREWDRFPGLREYLTSVHKHNCDMLHDLSIMAKAYKDYGEDERKNISQYSQMQAIREFASVCVNMPPTSAGLRRTQTYLLSQDEADIVCSKKFLKQLGEVRAHDKVKVAFSAKRIQRRGRDFVVDVQASFR